MSVVHNAKAMPAYVQMVARDITDRKLAERRLKEWLNNLQTVAPDLQKFAVAELVSRAVSGEAPKTRATNESILKRFSETSKPGLTTHLPPNAEQTARRLHSERMLSTHVDL